ncbi:hypothetical protein ACIGG9_10760 [Pseudonocardia alni]|uniref:hypothetical protein n=1 Tax=Pseudonocardia alni TaxID=33907 RepID=UPI0033C40545
MGWSIVYPVLDQIITLIATPLALLGLYLAWKEIRKTKTAAEAARDAAQRAQTALSRNSVVIILYQMQQVETELEKAISDKDRQRSIYWMSTWRSLAGQAVGHLKFINALSDELNEKILNSVETCGKAKNSLVGTAGDTVRISMPGLKSVTGVTADVGVLSVMQNLKSGESNEQLN